MALPLDANLDEDVEEAGMYEQLLAQKQNRWDRSTCTSFCGWS